MEVGGATSSITGGVSKPSTKHKALGEITGKEENVRKRQKVEVEYEEEAGEGVKSKSPLKLEESGSRGETDWGQDDEALLLAAALEEDKMSTTATVGSEGGASPFCACANPETAAGRTGVDFHQRYVVTKFLYQATDPGTKAPTTAYSIRNERSRKSTQLILRDSWARAPIMSEGTLVNIVDTHPDENGVFIVERDNGYLVVEPDRLVSVTNVASQCWCERKVAFSERIRFPVDNMDTLRGTVAHELIGQSMKKKLKTRPEVASELARILADVDIVEKAYSAGITQKPFAELGEDLIDWVVLFNKTRLFSRGNGQKWQINEVKDIEDCHWSPEFGLKGKVDCTVEVRAEFGEKLVVPLEFKTGNPRYAKKFNVRSEHTGQVQLYTLLMRNSLGLLHNKGILHYIRENNLVECTGAMRDLQALIMARNRVIFNTPLNGNKGPFASLPDPFGVEFKMHCQRCEYRNICAVSVKLKNASLIENANKTDIQQKLEDSIGYLTDEELAFFDKWLRVINLEADEDEKSFDTKNLWLNPIRQREKDGKCIGNLQFKELTYDETSTLVATFSIPPSKKEILGNIFERDFVVLGTDRDPCICYGAVQSISAYFVKISIERPLSERFDRPDISFTIDKVSSSSAGMMQFVYLSNLMEDTQQAARARKYVMGKKQPVFKTMSKQEFTKEQERILSKYNKMQRIAMLKCLTTDSFLFVKGSPGCGKTKTIVGLVRLLVARRKSVLISAYTSNAVDNILLKYKKYSQNFVRVGSGGKLNLDELADYSTDILRKKASNVDKLAEMYNSMPVVASTLLSLKHPIFKSRKFDYCIIDEGSQALPTAVFGTLLLAEKVVIFGDPNQLPATIKSKEVKKMKIEDSMFSLCSKPENTCDLSIQYRMNQYIMKLANELLYGNQMKCATTSQALESLNISGEKVKAYLLENVPLDMTRTWLCYSGSRRPERSVMFLDTQNINAFEKVVSSTLQNRNEMDIVMAIVPMLIFGGVSPKNIGVIAPYRGQVYLLRESCEALGIEVNTVDQYQGREKKVIIVSLTKSLPSEGDGFHEDGILNDVRRLNVAITRARYKVILIGNSKTLNRFPACNRLLALLEDPQRYTFCPDDFDTNFFKNDDN